MIGLCYIILYPLIVKFASTLMSEQDLFDLTVKWIPKRLNTNSIIRNYQDVYYAMKYPTALMNSVLLALLVSLLQLVSCTLIGYGFARYEYFGSNVVFALVILTLLVPPQMIMIPLFLNFRFFDVFGLLPQSMNLLGTY